MKLLGRKLMARNFDRRNFDRRNFDRRNFDRRNFDRQTAEIQIRIAILNRHTALGIPVTQPVNRPHRGKGEARPSTGLRNKVLPSSTMPEIAPEYAIFDLPFLVKDRAHLARIDETLFRDVLVPAAEAQGYRPLAIWENGFRQITNNVRPVVTPADLEGLKIRTPNSSWRVAMFEEYGANPTPMSFSEVFVALQTGVIDGQENPLTNIAGGKLNEVQTYLSMSNHVYSPAYPTVGIAAFERMDPEIQTILSETAAEVALWAREQGEMQDGTLLEELTAGGMEVNETDREAFVSASAPLYEKFADEVEDGQAMIDQALSLAKGS